MMFGCYRKQDANDPEIYVAAVTAVLSEYPREVIESVTDPRTGLPSRLKWLPTVAEVKEACEAVMWPIRFKERWRSDVSRQQSEVMPAKSESVNDGFKKLAAQLRSGIGPSSV